MWSAVVHGVRAFMMGVLSAAKEQVGACGEA